jgi:hypothetical protein
MSVIFDKMEKLANKIYIDIARGNREIESLVLSKFPWTNRVFRSDRFRRAHLEVLDVRESKKMYIIHVCIFPHLDDSSPIFGFDVICGANKITGVFLDFSMGDKNHFMNKWFKEKTSKLVWKKDRELPDWGKRIFSPNMVAAGMVNTDEELNQVIDVAKDCMKFYIDNVGLFYENKSYMVNHNLYCMNQKQNVHTSRFLINCGHKEEDVKNFIDNHLFPEVVLEQ